MLNVELVHKLIKSKGLKQTWIVSRMELGRTTAYSMLRDGLLPKDPDKRELALNTLATILGVEVLDILLRFVARETA